MTGLLIDIIWRPHLACLYTWNPSDLEESFTYCVLEPVSLIVFKYPIFFIHVASVNMLNIIFAVIFSLKLRKFVTLRRDTKSNTAQRLKFEALIIKNDLLTFVGLLSTSIGYSLWFAVRNMIIIHVDTLINTIVVGLMFSCNKRYYKLMCRPCIALCFKGCDPYSSKAELVKMTAVQSPRSPSDTSSPDSCDPESFNASHLRVDSVSERE